MNRVLSILSVLVIITELTMKPVDNMNAVAQSAPITDWVSVIADHPNVFSLVLSMAMDNNENIYVTGESTGTWGSPIRPHYGSDDVFVAKFDKNKTLIWNTFLGGAGSEQGISISVDPGGNIFISGIGTGNWEPQASLVPLAAYSGNPNSAFTAKLDSDGNLIWHTFPINGYNSYGNAVATDGNGNVFVGGTIENSIVETANAFLVKLNGNGVYQWGTALGGSDNDSGNDIVLDGDGSIFMIGESGSSWGQFPVRPYTSQHDIFIAKLNSSGTLQWNTFLGGNNDDLGSSIVLDEGGNIYAAGRSLGSWGTPIRPYSGNSTISLADDDDALIAKLAPNGNLLWHTFLGNDKSDEGWDITVDTGNIYLCGVSASSWGTAVWPHQGGDEAFVVSLDGNGALQWNGFLGHEGDDECLAIESIGNGYIYFGGVISSSITDSAYIAKFSLKDLTFADVPADYWASSFVERLSAAGITSGCGNGNYCPTTTVTRDQMAVFLLRGKHGSSYAPPTASGVFQDVPANYWSAAWIEQLAVEGITSGCSTSPKQYCPTTPVTRDQMAVFLLRAKHGSSYAPPPATGVFEDVPANYWAASWIEQLAAEGITDGCSTSPKLYCPNTPVTRDQMAVFLVRNFNLP